MRFEFEINVPDQKIEKLILEAIKEAAFNDIKSLDMALPYGLTYERQEEFQSALDKSYQKAFDLLLEQHRDELLNGIVSKLAGIIAKVQTDTE